MNKHAVDKTKTELALKSFFTTFDSFFVSKAKQYLGRQNAFAVEKNNNIAL